MSNGLMELRKNNIKNDIKSNKFKSKKDIMLNNGYALKTATHKASCNKLLNEAISEVREELRAKDVTVDWLLSQWTQGLTAAFQAQDFSTYNSILANIAKYIAQITEKHSSDITFSEADAVEIQALSNRIGSKLSNIN